MRIGIYGGNVRRGAALTSLVDEVAQMEERGFVSYWFSQVDTGLVVVDQMVLEGPPVWSAFGPQEDAKRRKMTRATE